MSNLLELSDANVSKGDIGLQYIQYQTNSLGTQTSSENSETTFRDARMIPRLEFFQSQY